MIGRRRRRWRARYGGRGLLIRRVATFFFVAAFLTGIYLSALKAVPERPSLTLSVYRHDIGQTVLLDLEDYVKGVVAAEMPADFHPEALKAQAVAARTLALLLWQAQEPLDVDANAMISTDHRVHQAWVSPEALIEQWGSAQYYWRWEKISRAVADTRGLVLMHHGELIYPAYHSSSGGRTEDSENYWASRTPYLRSVDDPYVSGTRYEKTEMQFSVAEVSQRTGAMLIPAAAGPFVQVISRFPGGRVERVRVGEKQMTGRELREALGLRSNWFDVVEQDGRVVFHVFGYGHGIGMSQYGADGMARAGFLFDQILSHYYTEVEIVSWYE